MASATDSGARAERIDLTFAERMSAPQGADYAPIGCQVVLNSMKSRIS